MDKLGNITLHNFEMTGIELDKDYYEGAKRRLQWHQAQHKLF